MDDIAGVRAPRRRLVMAEALCRASCVSCGVLEMFLDLIIKLWLMFRSRHLVLWSLGTYGTRESGKGTGCARGRRITPVHPI